MHAERYNLSPDIQTIIEAWPDLPEEVKAKIMEMVKAAKGKDG